MLVVIPEIAVPLFVAEGASVNPAGRTKRGMSRLIDRDLRHESFSGALVVALEGMSLRSSISFGCYCWHGASFLWFVDPFQ